jgi:hypothetical protein
MDKCIEDELLNASENTRLPPPIDWLLPVAGRDSEKGERKEGKRKRKKKGRRKGRGKVALSWILSASRKWPSTQNLHSLVFPCC